jgi:hypothetical protein
VTFREALPSSSLIQPCDNSRFWGVEVEPQNKCLNRLLIFREIQIPLFVSSLWTVRSLTWNINIIGPFTFIILYLLSCAGFQKMKREGQKASEAAGPNAKTVLSCQIWQLCLHIEPLMNFIRDLGELRFGQATRATRLLARQKTLLVTYFRQPASASQRILMTDLSRNFIMLFLDLWCHSFLSSY